MAKGQVPDAVNLAVKDFDEDKGAHDRFVEKLERRYRAYRGIMERKSEAAQWTNKLHPPYIAQVLETMIAGLLEPQPRWRLKATARMTAGPETERLREGAKALEILLRAQRQESWSLTNQRTHRLQALICGLTVAKTFWGYEEGERRRWQNVEEPIYDEYGTFAGSVPRQVQASGVDVIRDDPVCEVVDMRDFIWHEAAPSLDRAKRVTHRVWMTYDEVVDLYGEDKAKPLKESKSFAQEIVNREKDLFDNDRTKDQIEILEHWRRDRNGIRTIVVGNRKALLEDKRDKFWHGHYPFVGCSGMPDMFRIPGISEVELIAELQEMLWTLQNQQLDNLQLLNNAIILLRSDVDDPDMFEFAPGEKWLVDDPDQVQMWTPNPISAELAVGTIERMKGDLQAISGGAPWLSGDNRNTDSNTATEASILTNLAQRRVAAKRQFFLEADAEVGNHFIELNDQFLTEERYVQIVGADGEEGWELIDPQSWRDFQFRIEVDAMDESLMRQERRAEAQAKLQVFLAAVPVFAAISQVTPTVPALNPKAAMDDFLEAFGVQDKDRYYSALPQPATAPPGASQGPPGANGAPPGATAPQAVDANSPSNSFSQSPVAALQQMLSQSGGTVNV